ncbi:MAG TPA: RNA polymerase sigma factor [Actinobacteria bacterium]|nr:RNA polymerase sigma factor [Actinomycetota bacterium]
MRTVTPSDLAAALATDLDGAFPDLVRETSAGVFSGALRLVGNRHDAEEIAQEAFLRAYRALQGYPTDRIRDMNPAAWVWTIAANLCRNHHRTRSRRPVTADLTVDPTDRSPGPEAEAIDRTQEERLAAELQRLTWPMRAAVVLHHVVGLPYEEVAAALGRPVGTVKADAHRGLARLRSRIEEVRP